MNAYSKSALAFFLSAATASTLAEPIGIGDFTLRATQNIVSIRSIYQDNPAPLGTFGIVSTDDSNSFFGFITVAEEPLRTQLSNLQQNIVNQAPQQTDIFVLTSPTDTASTTVNNRTITLADQNESLPPIRAIDTNLDVRMALSAITPLFGGTDLSTSITSIFASRSDIPQSTPTSAGLELEIHALRTVSPLSGSVETAPVTLQESSRGNSVAYFRYDGTAAAVSAAEAFFGFNADSLGRIYTTTDNNGNETRLPPTWSTANINTGTTSTPPLILAGFDLDDDGDYNDAIVAMQGVDIQPLPTTGTVCFHDNVSFIGGFGEACIGTSQFNFNSTHNDNVSAITVGAGVHVIIYENFNYTGKTLCIPGSSSVNDLADLNNESSSFRVLNGATCPASLNTPETTNTPNTDNLPGFSLPASGRACFHRDVDAVTGFRACIGLSQFNFNSTHNDNVAAISVGDNVHVCFVARPFLNGLTHHVFAVVKVGLVETVAVRRVNNLQPLVKGKYDQVDRFQGIGTSLGPQLEGAQTKADSDVVKDVHAAFKGRAVYVIS